MTAVVPLHQRERKYQLENTHMKDETSRLLAYSKEFFISGEHELEQNTNLANMQAILKFHDAVEFCVRAIIEEFNVNHNRNDDLGDLIKCINKQLAAKSLPLSSQIDFLNTTRGKVKHHASVPSSEDVQRCGATAKSFLEQATKEYLSADFLSVSRLLLISQKQVKDNLLAAQAICNDGDYLEALILIRKAFDRARPSDRTFISEDAFFTSFLLTQGLGGTNQLKEAIRKIVDSVKDLRRTVALIMLGVDVLKLRRFEEITPRLTYFANGDVGIYWYEERVATREMVDEAMSFTIDSALFWERNGVIGHRPALFTPLSEVKHKGREVRRERDPDFSVNAGENPSREGTST